MQPGLFEMKLTEMYYHLQEQSLEKGGTVVKLNQIIRSLIGEVGVCGCVCKLAETPQLSFSST